MKKLLLLSNLLVIFSLFFGCKFAKNNTTAKSNTVQKDGIKSGVLTQDTILSKKTNARQKDSAKYAGDTLKVNRIEHGTANRQQLDSIKNRKTKGK
jgi:hypothetical protein